MKLKVLDADINELLWLSKEELNVEKFTLDADKVVVDLYKKKTSNLKTRSLLFFDHQNTV